MDEGGTQTGKKNTLEEVWVQRVNTDVLKYPIVLWKDIDVNSKVTKRGCRFYNALTTPPHLPYHGPLCIR